MHGCHLSFSSTEMQGCRGNTDWSWSEPRCAIHLWFNEKKKKKFIVQHMRKHSRSLHLGNTKDSDPIPFSVLTWSGFQHVASKALHHLQHTGCPTTQRSLSKSPLHLFSDGWLCFPRWNTVLLAPHPSLSPNSLAYTSHHSDEGCLEMISLSHKLPRGMLTASFQWLLLIKY